MALWHSENSEYTQISDNDFVMRTRIESVMMKHVTEMENYGYFGSNPGIPEDVLDDVAEEIMTELGLWEKKDE